MPIAKLEFNLPEEKSEFNIANKAGDYYCALWDMQEFLRSKLKYEELTEVEEKVYTEVREKFFEIVGNILDD